jgi:membrane-associated phospholipid phosphatase
MKLPYFKNKQKLWVGFLGITAFMVFYMLPNHFLIFDPIYLKMFAFEKSIPFIPWTIWIYISDYIYIAIVFILLKEKENMNKLFYSQIFLLFTAMIIFFLIPTTFPRPEVEYVGFSGLVIKLLYSSDNPNNACPSIHVAMTFLAYFGIIKEYKKYNILFLIWAILISLSTLTIKQHYVIDITCGFLMALLFYKLIYPKIEERRC